MLMVCRREVACEFCDRQLPDWKKTLTPVCGVTAPAVMNVNFNGRTYGFEVRDCTPPIHSLLLLVLDSATPAGLGVRSGHVVLRNRIVLYLFMVLYCWCFIIARDPRMKHRVL